MKSDVVAKRYARALYDLGMEEGLNDKILEDMKKVSEVIKESQEFRAMMESPLYDIILKKRVLKSVISKISLTEYLGNFLNILLDKDRFKLLDEILEAYTVMLDEASGRVRAQIKSATELSDEQMQRIKKTMSGLMKKEVDVDVAVDPSLIGGLVAEVQGMIYDGSVKTQLSKLKQSLKGEI